MAADLLAKPAEPAPQWLGPAEALRAAAVDFYHQSWRLAILNTALGALLLVAVYYALFSSALYALVALLLLVLIGGPLTVALVYATVTLAQTDELTLRDTLVGLRRLWLRGLALAALAGAVTLLGVTAIRFYSSRAWPLAVVAGDLLALFAITQISVWPRAVFERERPLHRVAADALVDLLRRPLPFIGLAVALALVNVVGIVAGVMPFLTLTIAYSFLAAGHFSLPRNSLRASTAES